MLFVHLLQCLLLLLDTITSLALHHLRWYLCLCPNMLRNALELTRRGMMVRWNASHALLLCLYDQLQL
jgi:hypothetical protein